MQKSFEARLRELRGNKSQAETANVFGIKQPTYCGWEKGTRKPNIIELRNICEHYHVSSDWILGMVSERITHATIRYPRVAEPKQYETPQPDAAHWRDLALSQQATINQLLELLSKHADKKNAAPAPTAHSGHHTSKAG